VRPREILGLLGVNGAGKSSVFKMIAGDVLPTGGDGFVAGCSVRSEQHLARKRIGMCPQHDAIIGRLTAREHLLLFAALRGISHADAAPLAQTLIRGVGLEPHADRLAMTYSGGNKRKLCLAIALVGSPALICLDEPSSGMDAAAKRSMWTAIRSHVAETGASALITTHSMEESEALCQRVGIMVAGRLRCLGTIHRLKSRFGDGYTATLRLADVAAVEAVAGLLARWAATDGPLASCSMQEVRGSTVTLKLPSAREGEPPALAALFCELEGARGAVGIEAYSVTQASLGARLAALARASASLACASRADPCDHLQAHRSAHARIRVSVRLPLAHMALCPPCPVHDAVGAARRCVLRLAALVALPPSSGPVLGLAERVFLTIAADGDAGEE
jgi:ABC-type multidrug transport system ATPase subunit